MAILNIRIEDEIKKELQEIAKLKNQTLSSLALDAITAMVENEFDYNLIAQVEKRRKLDEKVYPIEEIYQEYGIE